MRPSFRHSEIPEPRANHLLASLAPQDYGLLMREAQIVTLTFGTRLILQDARVKDVYFPLTCMFSVLVTNDNLPQMETATVGREGVVGAAESLQQVGGIGLHLIQIPGMALRIDANLFRQTVRKRPSVQSVINNHQYAFLRQILYGAACNSNHSVEERCARWLLMTHDRAGQDTFRLGHEFLSDILGVRRTSVNFATGMLKKAGFIKYVRGQLTVIDRPGLESAACDCYHAIAKVYLSRPSRGTWD